MRSFSNIEHVMPQRLSRTSSTDRSSVSGTPAAAGLPPRLGRSHSAGATKLAAFLPQPSPQMLVQPSSMRAAVSAAPGSSRFEPVTQGGRAPRYSEPISTGGVLGPDDRVELLLAEVSVAVCWATAGGVLGPAACLCAVAVTCAGPVTATRATSNQACNQAAFEC
jgi:hypothetical protein